MTKKKCIIYSRISSVNNNYRNFTSLKNQYNQCKEYADKNNYQIIESFEEVGSAKNIKKLPVLTNIVNNYYDITLLIRSVSRFSRNTLQGLEYFHILTNSNVKLIFTVDNLIIDLKNPHVMNRFRNLMSEAEMESAIASKRQKDSIRFRKLMGAYVGGVPFGFKLKNDSGISKLVIDDKENNIIKFIKEARIGKINSRKLSELMFKISNSKTPIEFIDYDGKTVIERFNKDKPFTLTYAEIADLLNDYNVKNRSKEWKAISVSRIFNKENNKKRKIKKLINDFNKKLECKTKSKKSVRRSKRKRKNIII